MAMMRELPGARKVAIWVIALYASTTVTCDLRAPETKWVFYQPVVGRGEITPLHRAGGGDRFFLQGIPGDCFWGDEFTVWILRLT